MSNLVLLEIIITIAFPITVWGIGKILSPKKPNPDKLRPFTGGEFSGKFRGRYLYQPVMKFIILFLMLDMFIFIMALPFQNKIIPSMYSGIILLGVLLTW